MANPQGNANGGVSGFQFDRNKFNEAILYIASQCQPRELGAVKLHKVLYYSDMIAYVAYEKPITGSRYRKRQMGPTSDHLLSALRDLALRGDIETHEVNYFGYLKKEYHAKRQPDLTRFSRPEIALMDEVIDFVCRNNTAKTISEFSHSRPWEIAEFGAELPYHGAFNLIATQVSQEAFDWAEKEAKSLEAQRSHNHAVEYRAFRDFRAGL